MIRDFLQNRHIPDDVKIVKRNGYIFFLHPFKRFDPVTMAITMGAGTVMQMQATKQQGKDAEKLAQQRTAIDIANAEATRKSSVEEAKIRGEKGRRLIETQKSKFAAGNIRINVGDPLVIEKETQEFIARDIGYVLERGRTESDMFRSSAAQEIAAGKAARKRSKSTALTQGLKGFGSMAMMGYKAGWFSKETT